MAMEVNNINALLNSGANSTLAIISLDDLRRFCKEFLEDAKKEFGEKIETDRTESYPTIDQVAEIFHVTRGTLDRWHKRSILRKYEIGGRRRYKMSEVNALMKGGRV